MPFYKIHSIKNNKKLSFIIEWESEEKVKQTLSLDGFIVITIDSLLEDQNQENYFIFNALKDNRNRVEGKIEAPDIFQAYKILKEDYQYTILKLYPVSLTDKKEQDFIFQNVLDVFSGHTHKDTIKENTEETKASTITTGEIITIKKYFEILTPLIAESVLGNKELLLYDIKKIMMTNSLSGMEILLKKTIKLLYEQSSLKTKKEIYKTILPGIKYAGVFVLPPWYYMLVAGARKVSEIGKILFLPTDASEKIQEQKEKLKKIALLQTKEKKNTQEKYIFSNKNIQLLLQKKYRSSWLDIFKPEGEYPYFYSLMRQVRILLWVKKLQEYIGLMCTYTWFLLVLGFLVTGAISSTAFLFFNTFLLPILSLIIVSLVFSVKEI